ncbi:hypothetical protein KCU59_g165, partial [Aureobasidium melanogenum]
MTSHVGLVQTPDGSWGVLGESEVGGEAAIVLGAVTETSALSGEPSMSESEAKKQGLSSPFLLFLVRRCGWRGKFGGERTGPPMAPRRTASADFAALRASSVRGTPCASIEACRGSASIVAD